MYHLPSCRWAGGEIDASLLLFEHHLSLDLSALTVSLAARRGQPVYSAPMEDAVSRRSWRGHPLMQILGSVSFIDQHAGHMTWAAGSHCLSSPGEVQCRRSPNSALQLPSGDWRFLDIPAPVLEVQRSTSDVRHVF
jgi:hypothetical protein